MGEYIQQNSEFFAMLLLNTGIGIGWLWDRYRQSAREGRKVRLDARDREYDDLDVIKSYYREEFQATNQRMRKIEDEAEQWKNIARDLQRELHDLRETCSKQSLLIDDLHRRLGVMNAANQQA